MPFTPPDLSEILTNEQTMNTRLTTYRNKLKAILDADGISYDENLGINGLIRLLQLPIPTTIELNPRKTFLTKDGPQTSNRSTYFSPVVRDQHGNSMTSVPLTITKKSSISGSSWQNVESIISGNNTSTYYADSNKDGYTYRVTATNNPQCYSEIYIPQYWFNYGGPYSDGYDNSGLPYGSINTTPIMSSNIGNYDWEPYYMGGGYFYVYPSADGDVFGVWQIKSPPPLTDNTATDSIIKIGFDVTRGSTPASTSFVGIGAGMVGNGSRNSMGVFLDASNADFLSTYDSSFSGTGSDKGFTVSGVSKELSCTIEGAYSTSTGAYTWFRNADESVEQYGPFWYISELGSSYGPCLILYAHNAQKNKQIRVRPKYMIATAR